MSKEFSPPGYQPPGPAPQGAFPPSHPGFHAGYDQPPPGQMMPPGQMPPPAYMQPPAANYALPQQPQITHQQTVVVTQQPQSNQVVIVQRDGVNHVLHCIISLFFWPWIIVWIIMCIQEGN